jgi:hypothetical protein
MAEFDLVILANHAEAHNGLLYLSGAGWNNANLAFTPEGPSTPFHFGIGISVLIPWTETNQPHQLEMWLEHEDGGEPLMRLEAELEVGRPPGIQHGTDQRAVMAVNVITVFPRPAGYRVVATLNGSQPRGVSFRVIALGGSPASRPQAAG